MTQGYHESGQWIRPQKKFHTSLYFYSWNILYTWCAKHYSRKSRDRSNYGLFKSIFWSNLDVLSQTRFDQDKMLHPSDFSLLMFGGKDNQYTQVVLYYVCTSLGLVLGLELGFLYFFQKLLFTHVCHVLYSNVC